MYSTASPDLAAQSIDQFIDSDNWLWPYLYFIYTFLDMIVSLFHLVFMAITLWTVFMLINAEKVWMRINHLHNTRDVGPLDQFQIDLCQKYMHLWYYEDLHSHSYLIFFSSFSYPIQNTSHKPTCSDKRKLINLVINCQKKIQV